MSMTFTKLFSSITESTVWCEPMATRLVWITMLAMADKQGRVWASVPGLANRARVPTDDCRKAIARFMAPDPDSRTPDHEGRRIEPIDGGWALLNHAKYREMRDDEARAEQNRQAQAKFRSKQSKPEVSHGKPESAQAEAEAEAEAEKTKTPSTRKKRELAPVPDDWTPSQKTIDRLSTEFNFSNGDAERYVRAFIDIAASKGHEYKNIDAAFSNCVRQDWPKMRSGKQAPNPWDGVS